MRFHVVAADFGVVVGSVSACLRMFGDSIKHHSACEDADEKPKNSDKKEDKDQIRQPNPKAGNIGTLITTYTMLGGSLLQLWYNIPHTLL